MNDNNCFNYTKQYNDKEMEKLNAEQFKQSIDRAKNNQNKRLPIISSIKKKKINLH